MLSQYKFIIEIELLCIRIKNKRLLGVTKLVLQLSYSENQFLIFVKRSIGS